MDNKVIIEEAKTYLNSDMTVKETANHLGISLRTFQLHLKKLELLDPRLHSLVINKKESNIISGRSKGGLVGHGGKVSNYTSDEIISMAKRIINEQLTYREAEEIFGIPSSTIHDLVHGKEVPLELLQMLDEVAYLNKKSMTLDEYVEVNKR